MHRVVILAFGLLFAVVSAGCEGGAANPVSPSALVDSGVTAGSETSATQARGGGGGKPSKGGGTLALVMVDDVNGDGLPNRGDSVTFNISTTVTTQPYVELICRQNGALVFGKVAGYFEGYQWPWSQVMRLSSDLWVGGAASCVADLYYFNKLTRTSMTTLSFTAYE